MARRTKAVKGLVNELLVQLKLAKDPNIIVFTLNLESGEYTAYDVKTKNFRKKDYQGTDGYKRNSTGSLINRNPTEEQKRLKVKIIYP